MYQDELANLTKDELIALVLAQTAQIEALTGRVAELEAKLGQPPKTPDNSSLPPSQGRKPNRAERRAGEKAKGASRRVSGACPQSGPDRCECCRTLPALRPRTEPGRSVWLSRL